MGSEMCIRDSIRAASPRLASLQQPQPLDLAGTRAVLDPGTLLLSYAAGDTQGFIFAIGPDPGDFAVLTMSAPLAKLRDEVARFRDLLLQRDGPLGTVPLRAQAERLSGIVLGPVADRIARAERILVVPDGPLHLIPFAALADPTPGHADRYLVEAKPVFTAASATVLAGLQASRAPARAARLLAFGDPDYSAFAKTSAAAVLRDVDLAPLPGSRREVPGLVDLYPQASRVYLGAEASEDQARKAGKEASLLHFACHAVADEASPLDSSLILALPADWRPGQPNGLLQAWEILEQMRIDADLVTLSACGTALGQELSGEGMVGLTRAFQYAGARSVLASLWAVDDQSTADLMTRFYSALREGATKDAALRAAQVGMIGSPRSSHPALWAAFALTGDWK